MLKKDSKILYIPLNIGVLIITLRAGKLIPLDKVLVQAITNMVPSLKQFSTISLSSTVRPIVECLKNLAKRTQKLRLHCNKPA